jgi:hypothetical protein
MMIAGKTPIIATSNGTTAAQHEGNATVQAVTLWQAFQSFFNTNGASVESTTNVGLVRRFVAALIQGHRRILSLATVRWGS